MSKTPQVDTSTTLPFTTTQKYRVESYTAMADEMAKYLVGPMPAQQFLDDFFPTSDLPGLESVPSFSSGCYHAAVMAKKEASAYGPFVKATESFAPGLLVVNSSGSPDCNPRLNFPFKIKPDVSVYPANSPSDTLTDSALAEIFIEFKWNTDDDPFQEVHNAQCARCGDAAVTSFLRESKAAKDTLGQITAYASAQLGSQFRTHVYSIFIMKQTARILRWDRTDTIVTEPIKYNESPLLAEFFRRYSKASPEMRSMDLSVSDPSPEEKIAAARALELDGAIPLVKLSVPGADGSSLYFVAPTPTSVLYTPPGRATRGFRAYDVSRGTLVFLKDSWRIDLPDIRPGGSVYKTLNDAGVRNVPRSLASGDILTAQYHKTQTWDYVKQPWACHSDTHFLPHRHYRLALDIIGRLLVQFNSSYEMVRAVRDALIAHMDAHKAGVLHRDLSPGNIIMDDNRGYLIDWDLSKPVGNQSQLETPRRATRMGTWQFMSANLIGQINGVHDFRDDLESSIYVVLWVTLVYSETSDRDQAAALLASVLDPSGRTGGYTKADFLQGTTFLRNVTFPHRPALHTLIGDLARLFAVRYESTPTEFINRSRLVQTSSRDTDLSHVAHDTYYKSRMALLSSHSKTVDLFDDSLQDRSQWPPYDRAVK
ncbi:hypothetical protein EDB83DRAFT_1848361 [Lactarius deliciosus]|nr:hypothetical protein EDB83DRAFT_1848361 [Lactarius deliciosus]